MAYIFGFRNREQGRNAAEVIQFDTYIAQEEQRIAQLRGLQLLHVARAPLGVEVRRGDVQAPPVAERHVRVHQPLHAHQLACREGRGVSD